MMLPADHEETMGEFAEKCVVLDLHIFFSIGNAEANVLAHSYLAVDFKSNNGIQGTPKAASDIDM